MFIADKNLSAMNDVQHGFFDRQDNELGAARAMGVTALHTVQQVHSAQCVYLPFTKPFPPAAGIPQEVKADAMVTDQPGQALGIITADCAPVLLTGRNGKGHPVIGAAHAGWRGALHGVIENTVAMMRDLGAENIIAAIGPCIARNSYEVSADFVAPFLEQDALNIDFFYDGKNDDVRQFDLPAYVLHRLKSAGIAQAGWCGIDTYTNATDYFSYRRATHKGEKDIGRQVSAIAICS